MSVFIVRQMAKGKMQYAMYNRKPAKTGKGYIGQKDSDGSMIMNSLAIGLIGREIEHGDCVQVIGSEVRQAQGVTA